LQRNPLKVGNRTADSTILWVKSNMIEKINIRFSLVLSVTIVIASCGNEHATIDAAKIADAPIQTVDAPPLPAMTTRTLAQCTTLGTGAETCGYQITLNPVACANQGCKKLAVFFAGGGQVCNQSIQDTYAAAGYVAVCALLFQTSDGTSLYPFAAEATRADAIMKAVADDPVVKAAWSGASMLITGVSHGATAPVTAMARTAFDAGPAWRGATHTGACFFDGIYNIAAIDELLGTGNAGGPCLSPVSHARMLGRYYSADPQVHSCVNNKCACDPDHAPEIDNDTIDAVAATEFAIKDWKLIECGSATAACASDIVPGPPISALCSNIDRSAQHTCAFESMPNDSHLTCAVSGINRCISWFDALSAL
jgi:hypothetical protein